MEIDQIYQKFPTDHECILYLEEVRWKGKPICPYCGSIRSTSIHKEWRYHCNKCHTSFSVTTGTVFHRTHLPLQKWFLAISLLLGEAITEAKQRSFLQPLVNM